MMDNPSHQAKALAGYPPEEVLAELMHKKLGVEVTPEALKRFLLNHWGMASMLAHMIHREADRYQHRNILRGQ